MRHKDKRLQLNRYTSWYRATLTSIAKSVLIHQSIRTTKKKAMAVRPLIEKLISLAKQNSLAAKRHAYKILGEHKLVSVLFSDIGPRFTKRTGGYIRIVGLGNRRGDGAQLAILELTEIKKKEIKKPKKETKKEEERPVEKPAEKPQEEQKPRTDTAVKEEKHPTETKKPPKKFLGGIRNIFKKERRDSL